MKNLIAQVQIAPNKGFTGFGPLGTPSGTGIEIFTKFISSVIGLMTIIAIIWFVFTFILGAIGIITAGGDKAAIESARKKIVNGVIGLVVTVIAIFIFRFIGFLIGIPNVLDINTLFCTITSC